MSYDDLCMLLCIFPMLTTTMVECRLFGYFLLMRERLKVINEAIGFYRNNLNSIESNNGVDRMNGIRSKIFFITEFGSSKINVEFNAKTVKRPQSNFADKLKSMLQRSWRFIKNLLNVRKNKIFATNFDAAFKNAAPEINHNSSDYYMKRVCSMQIIYAKLYEISDLISNAYGIQVIAIISVQFITLTTLLYYCTMKTIRWEFVTQMLFSSHHIHI